MTFEDLLGRKQLELVLGSLAVIWPMRHDGAVTRTIVRGRIREAKLLKQRMRNA